MSVTDQIQLEPSTPCKGLKVALCTWSPSPAMAINSRAVFRAQFPHTYTLNFLPFLFFRGMCDKQISLKALGPHALHTPPSMNTQHGQAGLKGWPLSRRPPKTVSICLFMAANIDNPPPPLVTSEKELRLACPPFSACITV